MLNDRQLRKMIGLRIEGGIIIGVRRLTIDTVEFDVLTDDGEQTYKICLGNS